MPGRIEFDEHAVSLGRAVVALGVEEKVLSNGLFSDQSLLERSSVVHGILEGLLTGGTWQNAVRLVHEPGVVKGLFDGDYERFYAGVIDSARMSSGPVHDSIVDTLVRDTMHGGPRVLYEIITHRDMAAKDVSSVFTKISPHMDTDKKKSISLRLATLALSEDNLGAAASYYKDAGDEGSAQALYTRMLERPAHYFHTLVGAVRSDGDRLRDILFRVARDPELDSHGALYLYQQAQRSHVHFDTADHARVVDLMIPRIGYHSIKDFPKDVRLEWAKANAEGHCGTAYGIFREEGYTGDLRDTAVIRGIERGFRHTQSSENSLHRFGVDKKDLEHVYDKLSREARVEVAPVIGPPAERFKALSREFAAEGDIKRAYHLWFEGNGDARDVYVTDLRDRLTDESIANAKAKALGYGSPSTHWLHHRDVLGHGVMYSRVLYDFPETAYELAVHIEDAQKVGHARALLIERSPEHALKIFRAKGHDEGTRAALGALSVKYAVPVEILQSLLE